MRMVKHSKNLKIWMAKVKKGGGDILSEKMLQKKTKKEKRR